MKHIVAALFLAVLTTLSLPALSGADDSALLDKLEEKGIVTPEEAREVREAYPRLNVGGFVHFMYERSEGDASKSKDGLQAKKVRFTFTAYPSEKGYLELQPAADAGTFSVKNAYVALTPDWGKVIIGNHYLAYSQEATRSNTSLSFSDKHLTSKLAPSYQPGISAELSFLSRIVNIKAGIWNGAVKNSMGSELAAGKLATPAIYKNDISGNDNNRYAYAFRINFSPLGPLPRGQENFDRVTKISLGAGCYASDDTPLAGHTSGVAELKGSNACEVDFQHMWGGLSTSGEAALRRMKWWMANDKAVTSTQTSFTLQGSYLIERDISLALRVEYLNYDDRNDYLRGVDGQLEDRWITVGLNWYLDRHRLKLQAHYIFKDDRMPSGVPGLKNNQFVLITGASF